ncbi:MAG: hypothetical protein JRJ59_10605 [Deltaproteobacteria bacterium]|nr:hypothetical protein [Deltaproteobacteria bacterium]
MKTCPKKTEQDQPVRDQPDAVRDLAAKAVKARAADKAGVRASQVKAWALAADKAGAKPDRAGVWGLAKAGA